VTLPTVVVPREAAERIRHALSRGGDVSAHRSDADDLYVVVGVRDGRLAMLPATVDRAFAALRGADLDASGQWARADPEVHVTHQNVLFRAGTAVPYATFVKMCPVVLDPGNTAGLLLTHVPEIADDLRSLGVAEFAGWYVTRQGVTALAVQVEPDAWGTAQLCDTWPLDRLAAVSVLVIGLGSIGGAIVDDLAAAGVGTIGLLDRDRVWWHNLVRHRLGRESVGRLKVDALHDRLRSRWPITAVRRHALDVVEDADAVRAFVGGYAAIVCAADGVAPRRVVSHLARRAGVPAVLACVLENGAVGEVLRLLPGPGDGCLLCRRAKLLRDGAMDVETGLELGYGTGSAHRPMTAVAPDLWLVASLAAKTVLATLIESRTGEWGQRLPGEHAVVGLRPVPGLAAPFDVGRVGEIRWHPAVAPRPDCPTCAPA